MAQDFYIDPKTGDWSLENGTTIRMCNNYQELTRQRLLIRLSMFRGEWFADVNFGIPYFESIYGKDNQAATDSILKAAIRNTEGVIRITKFLSELDKKTRLYTLTFSVTTREGAIDNIEVTL